MVSVIPIERVDLASYRSPRRFTNRSRKRPLQRDLQLLSEAYAAVSDAFKGVGDAEEAAKWRQKADEQAALAKTKPN